MLFQYPGDLLQVLPAHDGAGGVVGEGQDQQLGFGGDGGLQLLCRETEAVFGLGLDDHRHAPGHDGHGLVAHKGGLGDKHLVTGIDNGADAQINGL